MLLTGVSRLLAQSASAWMQPGLSHAQLIARQASSSTASSSPASDLEVKTASPSTHPPSLTPEQQATVDNAVRIAKAAAGKAAHIAALTALAGRYRDIHVSMEAVYAAQVKGATALLPQGSVPAKPPAPKDAYLSSPAFPISDVTQLPDNHPSVPQSEDVQLNTKYMDKLTCWLQTQPSHLESSVQLQAGINLFPPQEATYPTYIDFQAAMRLLDQHKSKQRMGKLKALRRSQDKYQLKAWDHRPGDV